MTAPALSTPRHSVSVAAVILDEPAKNVLLIRRRDNNHWEPPGGVLEMEETVEHGLRREVHEETNVEVGVGPLTGVYKNMPQGIINLVFRCTALSEAATQTSEAATIEWTPLEQVSARMTPAFAVRVLDALRPTGVKLRSHDGTHILDI